MLAPIILFVYNRPDHTQRTIEALKKNALASESELYIFSDAPKNEKQKLAVQQTREYLLSIAGFKKIRITERKTHQGLANSLIPGITEVISVHGNAIVLEDDLVSSKNFLQFMNDCLSFYENNPAVFAISGYNFPIEFPMDYKDDVYLSYRALSWGWGTWKNRWDKADWEVKDFKEFSRDTKAQEAFNRGGSDLTRMLTKQMHGKIDSWAIRWSYAQFRQGAYSVIPVKSKIKNIGADSSGTHVGKTKKFDVVLDDSSIPYHLSYDLAINPQISKNLLNIFKRKPFVLRLFQAILQKL